MNPTETLMKEHRLIEKVLGVLATLATNAGVGTLDRARAGEVLTFLREFADRCHHGKEEQHLFPQLAIHGYGPETGPVAVMLAEHEQGRACIRLMTAALAEGSDGLASKQFAHAGREYVALLLSHIQKEDQVLFRLADSVFSPEDQMGPGAHEKLHAIADGIIAAAR
jgi:hemerythrin-like domain-containing protein